MMSLRSLQILDALMEDYIETGLPVSSARLFEKYNFGIHPAMIRLELSGLEDRDFVEQPHHSAGRVPTDKGYEFFANRVMVRRQDAVLRHNLRRLLSRALWDEMSDAIMNELGAIVATREAENGEVRKRGLSELLENMSWDSREAICEVIEDFENLEKRVQSAEKLFDDDNFLNVYVGKRSPVTRSPHLAVIMGNYCIGGDKVCIMVIGPKRMDYEKAAGIFQGLKNT